MIPTILLTLYFAAGAFFARCVIHHGRRERFPAAVIARVAIAQFLFWPIAVSMIVTETLSAWWRAEPLDASDDPSDLNPEP